MQYASQALGFLSLRRISGVLLSAIRIWHLYEKNTQIHNESGSCWNGGRVDQLDLQRNFNQCIYSNPETLGPPVILCIRDLFKCFDPQCLVLFTWVRNRCFKKQEKCLFQWVGNNQSSIQELVALNNLHKVTFYITRPAISTAGNEVFGSFRVD